MNQIPGNLDKGANLNFKGKQVNDDFLAFCLHESIGLYSLLIN